MNATATRPPFSWWKFARTLIGLAIAPTLGASIGMTLILIPMIAIEAESIGAFFSEAAEGVPAMIMFTLIFGGIFGLAPALLIGWPLHLLLLLRGWTSIWVYIALGAVLGSVGMVLSVFVIESIES